MRSPQSKQSAGCGGDAPHCLHAERTHSLYSSEKCCGSLMKVGSEPACEACSTRRASRALVELETTTKEF